MSYKVHIPEKVAKAIARFHPNVRKRLQVALERLAEDPRPPTAIKLEGEQDHYRFRVGDYRIVYAIDDGRLIVVVVRVGHRGDVYTKRRKS